MNDNCVTYYKDKLDIPDLIRTMRDVQGYDFEDSFYICDVSDIIEKFLMWKHFLPRVTPYYAVKCNNYSGLLDVLAKLGTGFDCASRDEIETIRGFGVHSDRIIYANPIKRISDLLFAKERGVKRMTFDNECELLKVKKYYPEAELLIRIRCDAKKAYVKDLGRKYGCNPKTEANNLVLMAAKLNLKVVGVCFHVGSGCIDHNIFLEAISKTRKIFDFAAKVGAPMSVLDLGGGFVHDLPIFSQVSRIINHSIKTFFPGNDIEIMAEPGRYFAASAFTLVTKVVNVRQVENTDKPHFYYTINSGVHGGFAFMKYGAQLIQPEIIKKTAENNKRLYKSTLWGQTCDPSDKLHDHILLTKLEVDDIIFFRGFGAYSVSLTSNFNGFRFPEIKNYINVKDEHIEPHIEWHYRSSA